MLAETLAARRTQPGSTSPAMDWPAPASGEAGRAGAALTVIGRRRGPCLSRPFRHRRGRPHPHRRAGCQIAPTPADPGELARRRGGDVIRHGRAAPRQRQLLPARPRLPGRRSGALAAETALGPHRDLALAAATNHPPLPVHRLPRVAILATGDGSFTARHARRFARSSPPTRSSRRRCMAADRRRRA